MAIADLPVPNTGAVAALSTPETGAPVNGNEVASPTQQGFRSGLKTLGANLNALVGQTGEVLGLSEFANDRFKDAEQYTRDADTPGIKDFGQVKDFTTLTHFVGHLIGEGTASTLPALGLSVGLRRPVAGNIAGFGIPAAGQQVQNLNADPVAKAQGPGAVLRNAAVTGAAQGTILGTVGAPGQVASKLVGQGAKETLGAGVAKAAAGQAIAMPATDVVGQKMHQELNPDKPLDTSHLAEEAITGGVFGGVLGAAGHIPGQLAPAARGIAKSAGELKERFKKPEAPADPEVDMPPKSVDTDARVLQWLNDHEAAGKEYLKSKWEAVKSSGAFENVQDFMKDPGMLREAYNNLKADHYDANIKPVVDGVTQYAKDLAGRLKKKQETKYSMIGEKPDFKEMGQDVLAGNPIHIKSTAPEVSDFMTKNGYKQVQDGIWEPATKHSKMRDKTDTMILQTVAKVLPEDFVAQVPKEKVRAIADLFRKLAENPDEFTDTGVPKTLTKLLGGHEVFRDVMKDVQAAVGTDHGPVAKVFKAHKSMVDTQLRSIHEIIHAHGRDEHLMDPDKFQVLMDEAAPWLQKQLSDGKVDPQYQAKFNEIFEPGEHEAAAAKLEKLGDRPTTNDAAFKGAERDSPYDEHGELKSEDRAADPRLDQKFHDTARGAEEARRVAAELEEEFGRKNVRVKVKDDYNEAGEHMGTLSLHVESALQAGLDADAWTRVRESEKQNRSGLDNPTGGILTVKTTKGTENKINLVRLTNEMIRSEKSQRSGGKYIRDMVTQGLNALLNSDQFKGLKDELTSPSAKEKKLAQEWRDLKYAPADVANVGPRLAEIRKELAVLAEKRQWDLPDSTVVAITGTGKEKIHWTWGRIKDADLVQSKYASELRDAVRNGTPAERDAALAEISKYHDERSVDRTYVDGLQEKALTYLSEVGHDEASVHEALAPIQYALTAERAARGARPLSEKQQKFREVMARKWKAASPEQRAEWERIRAEWDKEKPPSRLERYLDAAEDRVYIEAERMQESEQERSIDNPDFVRSEDGPRPGYDADTQLPLYNEAPAGPKSKPDVEAVTTGKVNLESLRNEYPNATPERKAEIKAIAEKALGKAADFSDPRGKRGIAATTPAFAEPTVKTAVAEHEKAVFHTNSTADKLIEQARKDIAKKAGPRTDRLDPLGREGVVHDSNGNEYTDAGEAYRKAHGYDKALDIARREVEGAIEKEASPALDRQQEILKAAVEKALKPDGTKYSLMGNKHPFDELSDKEMEGIHEAYAELIGPHGNETEAVYLARMAKEFESAPADIAGLPNALNHPRINKTEIFGTESATKAFEAMMNKALKNSDRASEDLDKLLGRFSTKYSLMDGKPDLETIWQLHLPMHRQSKTVQEAMKQMKKDFGKDLPDGELTYKDIFEALGEDYKALHEYLRSVGITETRKNGIGHGTENFSTMNVGSGPATPEQIQAVRDYITKVLGDKVAVDFIEKLGHAGEFAKINGEEMIKISTMAADPLSVGYHEAVHALFARFMAVDQKAAHTLRRAAEAPAIVARLRTLLKDHPEALKQLADPEERVAYMYQFAAAGHKGLINIGPETKSVFDKIKGVFRKIAAIWADDFATAEAIEKAGDILSAFHNGAFAEKSTVAQVLADRFPRGPYEAAEQMMPWLGRLTNKFLWTSTGAVRDMNLPAATRIMDAFHTEIGQDKGPGFVQAKHVAYNQFINQIGDAFKTMPTKERQEIVMDDLRSGKPPETNEGKQIRKVLDDAHDYLIKKNVQLIVKAKDGRLNLEPIGKVENYFPRVYNQELLRTPEGKQKFLDALGPHMSAEAAVDVYDNVTKYADSGKPGEEDSALGLTYYTPALQKRMLGLSDAELAPFLSTDLFGTLSQYLQRATRRGEYATRFGNMGEEIATARKQAQKEGMTAEQGKIFDQSVQAMEGTLGADIDPKLKNIYSGLMTYQNIRLLPLQLFSSLIDPLGIVVRGGEMKEAFAAFGKGLRDLAAFKHDDAFELAKTVGAIDTANAHGLMSEMAGSEYMPKIQRAINDKFFRYNGMEKWNNRMRAQAAVAAENFIDKHMNRPTEHSERFMTELGLKKGDDLTVNNPKYVSAVNKWVDEAILRPNAALRPVYMSDPNWMLISHLKQYTYLFQKVIVARVYHELQHNNYTPAMALAAYVPGMVAADMLKMVMTPGSGDDNARAGWTAKDWVGHGLQRAGLFGPSQYGLEAGTDAQRGGIGLESAAGPTVQQFIQTVRGTVQGHGMLQVEKAIPGYNLVKPAGSHTGTKS